MGPVAITFGILCAVVLVAAAFCRSRDAIIASLVLTGLWALTKVVVVDRNSAEGIMVAAGSKAAIGLTGLWLMHRRPHLIWPRILVCSQLVAAFLVVLWAAALNSGFNPPLYPYAVCLNLLYLIALLAVLSLGLHDGAVSFRLWLSRHHHDRPWSRSGARWGRDNPIPPKGLKQR